MADIILNSEHKFGAGLPILTEWCSDGKNVWESSLKTVIILAISFIATDGAEMTYFTFKEWGRHMNM